MARQAKDEAREQRINWEIVVDANGPEEQAMGWYYYLDDTIHFPFSARCVARRPTSPLDRRASRWMRRPNRPSRIGTIGYTGDTSCNIGI